MTPDASIDLARPERYTATAIAGSAAWWSRRAALAAVVAVLAAAAYANSLANGFAYDDVWIIERNPRVHQLTNQAAIWLTPYWPIFGAHVGLYRPLTIFAFALEWAAGEGRPWVFHLVNVLLHAGVSGLVFRLACCFVSTPAAFVGALLFAVHPVHTEAVANVVGQAELIAAAGVMGACVLHAGRPTGLRVPVVRLLGIALLYAIALLAKESAIVLPILLLALDIAQRRIRFSQEDLLHYSDAMIVPLMLLGAIAAAYIGLRIEVLGSIAGEDAAPALPFLREEHRVLNAFRAWPEYARLLFFPDRLSADYSPAVILPVHSITPFVGLGAGLFGVTLLLACALPLRPSALPAAWFLVAILPVSNLLVPIGVLVAERTLYVPSVAVALAAAFASDALKRRAGHRGRVLGAAAVAVIVMLFAARVVVRNAEWKNTFSILAALLRDHPESYRGHWFAGVHLLAAGDTAAAEDHWLLAHRLWPRDAHLLLEWGHYALSRGDVEAAIERLEKGRKIKPHIPAMLGNLATAYLRAGRLQEALATSDSLLILTGPTPPVLELRAQILSGLGRHTAATNALRIAIQMSNGGNWAQWHLLARVGKNAEDLSLAFAALDSARSRIGDDSIAAKQVAELERELQRRAPAARRGRSPAVHHGRPQSANGLQNATLPPSSGGAPGSR